MNLLRIFFYANLAAILKMFGFWYVTWCYVTGVEGRFAFASDKRKTRQASLHKWEWQGEKDPMLFNDVQDKKGSASVLKYERK